MKPKINKNQKTVFSAATLKSKKEIKASSKVSQGVKPEKSDSRKEVRPIARSVPGSSSHKTSPPIKSPKGEAGKKVVKKREAVSGSNLPKGVLRVYDALQYPSNHPNAFIDANGRAVRATTTPGFLIFGQYEKNFPVQDLAAIFSVTVDNNTFDDAYVCTLDVTQDASRVIAKRVMTRKDFAEAQKHIRLVLPFRPSSTESQLEFRLLYMGYTYMAIKLVCIIDPAIITDINRDLPSDEELLKMVRPSIRSTYIYDLKTQGTSLYNGSQKLTVTGWSTYMWTNLQTHPWNPYKGKSCQEFADLLVQYNANLTRTFCIDTWTSSLFPWKRVGSKFDLNQFDSTYMDNLRNLISTFGSRGIIVQLDLFDNVSLYDFGDGMTWTKHPWHPNNALKAPISNPKDGRPEFYNPNWTVKTLQEKYLRYMVNSLRDLKNIIFEVCNEYNGWGGASWHNWVADVIKSENPSVLVSASTDVNVPVSDQIFRYSAVDITTSHANEWTTGDFKILNQSALDRLKAYGKPAVLSTDGCKENYDAQKNSMFNVANAVISQGFGIEFKDLYEPLANMLKPLAVPIQPVTLSLFV
jgi:hypothetical protein